MRCWRIDPGDLVHVGPDLGVESEVVLAAPPARLVPIGDHNPNIDS
jgi:hypothetical protein